MKNLLRLLTPAAIGLLAVSCVQDLDFQVPEEGTRTLRFTAVFGTPTRTSLSDSGKTRSVTWNVGDELLYCTDDGINGSVTIAAGEQDGVPSGRIEFDGIKRTSAYILAAYGSSEIDYDNLLYLKGVAGAAQSHTDFSNVHVCAAFSETGLDEWAPLHFQNVVSVLKFTSSPEVAKIEIEGKNSEPIAVKGENSWISVAFENGVISDVAPMRANDAKSIITVETSAQTATDYYVAILPTFFAGGLQLRSYDAQGTLLKTTVTASNLALGRTANGAIRSKVLYLGNVADWPDGEAAPAPVLADGISIFSNGQQTSSASLTTGEQLQLMAEVYASSPDEVPAFTTVTWSSSNDAVASVSEDGLVTALSEGTAVITATVNTELTTTGSPISASCTVSVSAPAPVDPYIDLSASETANCYIVARTDTLYRFNACVKGNGNGSNVQIAPFNCRLMWESRNQSSTVNSILPGAVVSDVKLRDDGYVTFRANGFGSALIAVTDIDGVILWSWHIWVWPGYSAATNYQIYKREAGILMDRDLGADSNYSQGAARDLDGYGLLYQWGRKDPFFTRRMRVWTGTTPGEQTSDATIGTVEGAIKNPTTYVLFAANNAQDWLYGKRDDTLWGLTKTIYDPCPPGWKVPYTSFWSKALGVSSTATFPSLDNSHGGVNFTGVMADYPIVYYPASGAMKGTSLTAYGADDNQYRTNQGFWWTCGVKDVSGRLMSVTRSDASVIPLDAGGRSHGYSVRCMLVDPSSIEDPEPVDPIDEPTDVAVITVSLDVNAKGLRVGETLTLTATVTPDNATDKTIIWSSSNANVATVKDGVVTAVGAGTATITATSKMVSTISDKCIVTVTDPDAGGRTDLSAGGTANSYIVSAPGQYMFKATVKGNSTETIAPVKAVWLWQSYGTNAGYCSILEDTEVYLHEGYVYFSIPSDMRNGNALIAALNANNEVLWSWHIWSYVNFDPVANAQVYNDGTTVMDRNLGATSSTPGEIGTYGLLYQWGRKDPFLNSYMLWSRTDGTWENSVAASRVNSQYGNWSSPIMADLTDVPGYCIKNPMAFIKSSSNDWRPSPDNNLWSGEKKTMYDPCPPGWMMPKGGKNGLWAASLGGATAKGSYDSNVTFGATISVLSSESVWYPLAGYRNSSSRTDKFVATGQQAKIWSGTYYSNKQGNSFSMEGETFQCAANIDKKMGHSVRCVAEPQ